MTVEPKLDQLPTANVRITANSYPIMETERRKSAPMRRWICFKVYLSPLSAHPRLLR